MTATSVRSRKAKGRDFQKDIANKIRERLSLEERDVVPVPASVNGVDIILSEKAKKLFPFSCELKRVEKLNIWSAINQAEANVLEDTIPILIFKKNRSESYCTLKFEDFLDLFIQKEQLSDK